MFRCQGIKVEMKDALKYIYTKKFPDEYVDLWYSVFPPILNTYNDLNDIINQYLKLHPVIEDLLFFKLCRKFFVNNRRSHNLTFLYANGNLYLGKFAYYISCPTKNPCIDKAIAENIKKIGITQKFTVETHIIPIRDNLDYFSKKKNELGI